MLTPSYLETLGDNIFTILDPLIEDILKDTARRIVKMGKLTATAEWQINRAEALIGNREYIRKTISIYSGKIESEIEDIFSKAAYKSADSDFEKYKKAYDMGLIQTKPIHIFNTRQGQQIFEAAMNKTKGEIRNLTGTLLSNNRLFVGQLDKAHDQIVSGAFDYISVSRKATKTLSQVMTKVTYPSGHRDFIDVAAWRAARTGASQTAGELSMMNFKMMDGNLVKTTQHLGERPSHSEWSGETFWVNTPYKNFRSFYEITQYGESLGLKGINCRHDFYAVFDELDNLDKEPRIKSDDGRSNEEHYNAEQKARGYEREIRALKRERTMFREFDDKDNVRGLNIEIRALKDKYDAHNEKFGLQERPHRLTI